ncbi:hypothetical protein PL18_11715 [Vibrio renipiscarius]|uniref:Uncharacterized protein n=1 Tax=Vibrio renipiscarius TaxID=1461322 RepID=A0A0C2NGG2_9VIBR|nr:hypothetical protein PL18_11715 [Vibrio renipiscarius]KII80554.1 hypothetical protein OJ16_04385 [Vibrio renipiscarius]
MILILFFALQQHPLKISPPPYTAYSQKIENVQFLAVAHHLNFTTNFDQNNNKALSDIALAKILL